MLSRYYTIERIIYVRSLRSIMIRAILFDVIGTTVLEKDPETVVHCVEAAFQLHDIYPSRSLITANRGREKQEMINLILREMKADSSIGPAVYQSFHKQFYDRLDNFQARPEAMLLFETLKNKGILVGIGTGLSADLLGLIKQGVGWHEFPFDYEGHSSSRMRGRPHPDMIIDMMSRLSIDHPHHLLKVGDTVSDIQEGQNAGVRTVALLAHTQPDEMLTQQRPDYIIQNLNEVLNLLR